uniref:Potassium channel tetramerization domain containing 20 n=1 Tax=Nothoprocta perdicaria TaxID=30464 RepID=A0A8C6ZB84_NOTPE
MNVNCAAGTGWSRNRDSSCSVENTTAPGHEPQENNVVLGGHSPSSGPRSEGCLDQEENITSPGQMKRENMKSQKELAQLSSGPCWIITKRGSLIALMGFQSQTFETRAITSASTLTSTQSNVRI